MLRTNLSTRPFYNVTVVRGGLAAFALALLALSAFNVLHVMSLNGQERTLSARATAALAEAGRLRSEAKRIRAQVDPKEIETVSAAAREANDAIDQKAFSWEHLLAQLETALPDDARVTSIAPRVERGVISVSLMVEAKTDKDIAAFIGALEGQSTFKNVLLDTTEPGQDDIIKAKIDSTYVPPARTASTEGPARTTGEGGASHD
jgi:Tfp pilus assembly protein PilN